MISGSIHNLLAFAYDIDSPAYIAMAEGRWRHDQEVEMNA